MADPDDTGDLRDELERHRHELDRLRQAALELRRAYHAREADLEGLRHEAAEVARRYARLRNRTVVRTLIGGARLARPVLARTRRLLGRPGGAGTPDAAPPATGEERTGPGEDDPGDLGAPRPAHQDAPPRFRRGLEAKLRARDGAAAVVELAGAPPGDVASGGTALAAALRGHGWQVRHVEAVGAATGADVVVLSDPQALDRALPRRAVVAGLALDRLDDWTASESFDDLDVVLVTDRCAAATVAERTAKAAVALDGRDPAAALRDALLGWCAATRISLTVATPSWAVAEWWGDTHYGRALQRQLERRGHPTRLYLRDEHAAAHRVRADVAVHLFGLAAPRPHPEQTSVLWVISHPELVDGQRCSGYNLVLVASERFAARLTPLVDAPVLPMAQATDAERFRPEPTGPAHDLLFVGNSRRTRRTIIDDLTPTAHDLAVYGADWTPDLLDPRHLRGPVVPNAELHRYYSSARIVLNDHWPEMAAAGFVSNRIYDALATGTLVVSDPVDGIERQFDGAVVTYRDRDDLRRQVARYLADERARRERAARGRQVVLERHTFAHRVDRLLELLAPYLAVRPTARG